MKQQQNKQWIVYRHISPSGKSYIGITFRPPEVRWANGHGYSSNTKIGQAITKYGWNNIQHEILETNIDSLEKAKEREIYWINFYDSYKNGYNSTLGGDSVSLERVTNIPVYQLNYKLEIVNSYPTLADAARAIGLKSSNGIIEAIKSNGNQITAGGYYWCLQSEYSSQWKPKQDQHKRQVICIETGQIFESESEAANFIGVTQASISSCCHNKTITCQNKHWVFLSDYNENWQPREYIKKDIPTKRKIICIETREIYESVLQASQILNIERSDITRACREHRMAKQLHFAYLDEYDANTWEPHKNLQSNSPRSKSVICLTNNITYPSIAAAAKELGITSSLISRCCSGKLETTHGLKFKYKEE